MASVSISWLAFALSILSVLVSAAVALVGQRDKARFEAKMNYELEARKRLLQAIGPLRFQLLLASQEAVTRIHQLGSGRWEMDLRRYYARDTLFRILRPLAVAQLIERQTNYVDFSVDSSLLHIFRFYTAALECFTGGDVVKSLEGKKDLEGVDWTSEREHPFKGTVEAAANSLIISDGDIERCVRKHEFPGLLEREVGIKPPSALSVFANFIDSLTPRGRPIFWLRLISFGYICYEFIATDGRAAGLSPPEYPLGQLLKASNQPNISELESVLSQRLDRMYSSTFAI